MAFLEDMVTVCEGANVGTFQTDLFASAVAKIPTGTVTTLIETAGLRSVRTHNARGDAYERPEAQLKVRAVLYTDARDTAWRAYRALRDIENTTINGTPYLAVEPKQPPSDMGVDPQGRAMVGFTFRAVKRPSAG